MKNSKLILGFGLALSLFTQYTFAWSGGFTITNNSNIDTLTVNRWYQTGNWGCTNTDGTPAIAVPGMDAVTVNPSSGISCETTTNSNQFHSKWNITNNAIPTELAGINYYCDGTNSNCALLPSGSTFDVYSTNPSYLFSYSNDDHNVTYVSHSCPSLASVQEILNSGNCGKHFTYQGDSTWGIFCAVSSKKSASKALQAPIPTVTNFSGATIQSGAYAQCSYNDGNIVMHNDNNQVIFPTQGVGGWYVNGGTATCDGSYNGTSIDPTQCQWDETGE